MQTTPQQEARCWDWATENYRSTLKLMPLLLYCTTYLTC